MSEPLSPPTQSPGSDPVYQPISGFALAGLIISAGYAAVVLVSTAVAIMMRAPIFFPLWTLLFPAAGVALCLYGRNEILGSEGTRAGLGLTKWGIGLGLLSGLGYFAYFSTVGLAVGSQADAFINGPAEPDSGFLAHLAKDSNRDYDIAFLLTKPAGSSRIKNPGDEAAMLAAYDKSGPEGGSELMRFREGFLANMIRRAGDKLKVESLGVRGWSYEKGSYKVGRAYRLTTPEAVLEIVFDVNSTEGEVAGQRRQWFVNLPFSPVVSKNLTPLGETIQSLRSSGKAYLEGPWRERLKPAAGEKFGSAGDLSKTDRTDDWDRLVPDADEFMKNGKNVHREHYKKAVRAAFDGSETTYFTVHIDPTHWPRWDRDPEGRLRMEFPIRLPAMGAPDIPNMTAEGVIRLRTKDAFDPAVGGSPPEWQFQDLRITRVRAGKGM